MQQLIASQFVENIYKVFNECGVDLEEALEQVKDQNNEANKE